MNRPLKSAVTLIELMISVVLFSVIILGIVSFDAASRRFLRSTERRTKVVNEAMFIFDHLSKSLSIALGHITDPGIEVAWEANVANCTSGNPPNCRIDIRVADPGNINTIIPPYTGSLWRRYAYDNNSHEFSYYPNRTNTSVSQVLSGNRIIDFELSSPTATGDPNRIQIAAFVIGYEWDGPEDDAANNPIVTLDDLDLDLTSFSQSCR